jgi:hypothetical protein
MGQQTIGIDDRYSPPGEIMMQIFGKQQPASVFSGNRQNQGVPDTETLIHGKIKRRLKGGPGRIGNVEAVGPLLNNNSGSYRRNFRLAGQHPIKFTKDLNRQQCY